MIACIQMRLDETTYRTEQSFRKRIFDLVKEARQRANSDQLMVVFPEHIGTFCLLCDESESVWSSSSFPEAVSKIVKAHFVAAGWRKLLNRVSWIRALALAKSGAAQRIYISTFQEAARHFNAWIVGGSTLAVAENGKDVRNTSYVFHPSGEIILQQNKVHLVDMEGPNGLDLSCGTTESLHVVHSPFGKLGVAVCLDAFREDVWNQLHSLGADILIQPSANNHAWDEWQSQDWLTGSYEAVYHKHLFTMAINPMLVGRLWDLEFEGQSSIIGQSGFIERAQSSDKEEILYCATRP